MGSLADASTLPYWQVNVPPEEREEECPPFLLSAKGKDVEILGTPDSEYKRMTWPELQGHISRNRLDIFQRTPIELRRYFAFNYEIKKKYGSIMNFVLGEKLHWEHPIVADGEPFEKDSDLSIKRNDWPYGIDERISHLVVWTKFPLEEDPTTGGDLSDRQRKQIDDYVEKTFRVQCGSDNVIWFRNWAALKSVHSVEHFHVMLFNADQKFLDSITGGDVPISETV
ncbi:hypothetical protein V495_06266 [Pseudogymnoascus sp. VKM F-4514 (FW-929)]|nr:hypothetical protein V495_06266 [Pseudogymnoascus sp. VKM F-4514 (FW-929)]KFY56460.1 hypothetical protein V497_06214 [Pseudogymnoascus sp. VKM F-4516 (FW-969)]